MAGQARRKACVLCWFVVNTYNGNYCIEPEIHCEKICLLGSLEHATTAFGIIALNRKSKLIRFLKISPSSCITLTNPEFATTFEIELVD